MNDEDEFQEIKARWNHTPTVGLEANYLRWARRDIAWLVARVEKLELDVRLLEHEQQYPR